MLTLKQKAARAFLLGSVAFGLISAPLVVPTVNTVQYVSGGVDQGSGGG